MWRISAADAFEKASEQAPVIEIYHEIAELKLAKNIIDNRGYLRIVSERQFLCADNIYIALIKLSVSPLLRAFTAENLAYLISLEGKNQFTLMHGDISRKRHREVKAQCDIVFALCEAVNLLFRFTARLCEQNIGALDGRRIYR